MKNIAVVLFNLGGPDSLESVETFLFNLFSDKDIINIPFGQKFLARFISSRRAPRIVEQYKKIGGKSPLGEWTELQRSNLEIKLNVDSKNISYKVFTAMRYWKPFTKDAINSICNSDINFSEIILLPLYPHYSVSTTGSSFNEWKREYKGKIPFVLIEQYFDNPGYIGVVNEHIDKGLELFPKELRDDVVLVFSAHGTPVSMVKKGDPYSHQIAKTVELAMMSRHNKSEYRLCFQSKVGPVKWLEPSTDNAIRELASLGKRNLLIIPISFVSDHVETLFELNIEYRHVADSCGIENYKVMPGFNGSASFVNLLSKLVEQKLNREK